MTAFTRPSSMNSDSFTCTLSVENDSSQRDMVIGSVPLGDIAANPPPSPLEYHFFMVKIAYILHRHIKGIKLRSAMTIRRALHELNLVMQKLPAHLSRFGHDELCLQWDDMFPSIPIQRSLVRLLLEVSRINLCISHLPQPPETGQDNLDLHESGLQAATDFVEIRRRDPSKIFKKFWGVPVCTAAAGMFLALDLICFEAVKSPSEIEQQQENIDFALSACMMQICLNTANLISCDA